MADKPQFPKNLKLVLPYSSEEKKAEFHNIVNRHKKGEIKIFKIKFIQPPVLYKKGFDPNKHQKQDRILKTTGYILSIDNAEFTENGIIYHNALFDYNWIDTVHYYIRKQT